MAGPSRLVRAGWAAPGGDLLVGALVALAATGPLVAAAGLAGPIAAGAATALAVPLQLGLTYAVAGRRALRRGAGR